MRALAAVALVVLVASCHREPTAADCATLVRTPLRALDAHSFARTCGPLLPPACRPPTTGTPDVTTLPRLEAACRAATSATGDVFELALPASISAEDRRVVAMALRSELAPPAVKVHVHATDVDIDGKHMSVDEAAAAVKAHGGGATLWESQDAPETTKALMHALAGEQVVICARDHANCR